MNEQLKEETYHKEDFYKGMAAIVSQANWHRLSYGAAVAVADRATSGACHHGGIGDAFLDLCEEKVRQEVRFNKSKK